MSKVFVTQEVGKVDYTPATKFGDLVFVTSMNDRLSPFPNSLNNDNIITKMARILDDFNDDDYLICTGAPAYMAIAASILGDRMRKLLVWDNRSMSYFEVVVNQ